MYYGIDPAAGHDYGVTTVWARPSRFERLLRRLGLSRATWEIKLLRVERHK